MTRFWKAYAEGNSYVIVESPADTARLLPRIVDPRYGLGGDGLLVVDWGLEWGQPIGMRVINADGSEAPACGNGARCLAALAITTGRASADDPVVVASAGAALTHRLADRQRLRLTQTMELPASPMVWRDDNVYQFSLGTDHRVVFADLTGLDAEREGGRHCDAWPGGTNVMFTRVAGDGQLDVIPWERGVGLTLGCATGAAAAAIAAGDHVPHWPDTVLVRQPGGSVEVQWVNGSLAITGTVRFIAEGTLT